MKKLTKIRVISMVLVLMLCLSACDLNSIIKRLPYDIESWHEHSWDNWELVYEEKDVRLVCSICSQTVKSYPISQGLEFDDRGALVGRGTCTDQYIVVPQGVTSVYKEAFANDNDLIGILLPDTVANIGENAFKNCNGLQVINIPNGVTEIGNSAFFSCKALIGVLIPNSVKSIGSKAFGNCGYLEVIYYVGTEEEWNSVSKGKDWNAGAGKHVVKFKMMVGDDPFAHTHTWRDWVVIEYATVENEGLIEGYCSCGEKLREVVPKVIPNTNEFEFRMNEDGKSYTVCGYNGYEKILDVAVVPNVYEGFPVTSIDHLPPHFLGKRLVLPNTIKDIRYGAFCNCTELVSINIPASVTNIEDEAFYRCYSLKNVEFEKGSHLTHLGYMAFQECWSLESIVLPDSLCEIPSQAFYWCEALKSVTIPSSVTSVGSIPFDYCGVLQYNEYDNAYYLGNENNPYHVLVMAKNQNITSCHIHPDTKAIAGNAFDECDAITDIVIPEGVISIGLYAFENCDLLTSVVVPDTVTEIADGVFNECQSLTSIKLTGINKEYKLIDGNLYTKDGKTFKQYLISKKDTRFDIPDGVENIGYGAFRGSQYLKTVVVPDSVVYLDFYAFSYCANLSEVRFGKNSNLEVIDFFAFWECTSLTTFKFPKSLMVIYHFAFQDCTALSNIIFEGTVSQWSSITKWSDWDRNVPATHVVCSDGTSTLNMKIEK